MMSVPFLLHEIRITEVEIALGPPATRQAARNFKQCGRVVVCLRLPSDVRSPKTRPREQVSLISEHRWARGRGTQNRIRAINYES